MKIEIRNDKIIIDGYVNAVERFSKPLFDTRGKFIERILPNVFRRALEKNDDVKVLLDHDKNKELANTKDGTATLYEDNIGLRAIVEITNAEVIKKAKEKKLKGWSFGFSCNKEERKVGESGLEERTLRDIDLMEVSIIDDKKTPAYYGTSIEVRSSGEKLIEYRGGEFDDATTQIKEVEELTDFDSMTASQKREILNGTYRKLFNDGWLDDYDDNYVYGTVKEGNTLFRMPYSITEGTVSIDTSNQVKVVRGGYKELREDNQVPEQQPNKKEVEKIDYSSYEERLKKIKEDK